MDMSSRLLGGPEDYPSNDYNLAQRNSVWKMVVTSAEIRLHRLTVRTAAFQAVNTSSNLVGVTIINNASLTGVPRMIDYYTVTLNDKKEDVRGVWIGLALDESDARSIFTHMYGVDYGKLAEVKAGIHMEDCCDLITESAKKHLLKFKMNNEDKPLSIVYTNFLHLTH